MTGPSRRPRGRAGGGTAVRLSGPGGRDGADVGELAEARGAGQCGEERADFGQLQLRVTLFPARQLSPAQITLGSSPDCVRDMVLHERQRLLVTCYGFVQPKNGILSNHNL